METTTRNAISSPSNFIKPQFRSMLIKNRLVAGEIVESHKRTKLDLLRPGIKVVPNAIRVAKLLATSRRMGREIKVCRLFVQEKDVPMRCTHGGRSRADVIGDEGRVRYKHTVAGDLEIGLDPVKDGSQDSEGRERSVDIQAYDQVGAGGVGAGEGELWGLLGCCGFCQFISRLLITRRGEGREGGGY